MQYAEWENILKGTLSQVPDYEHKHIPVTFILYYLFIFFNSCIFYFLFYLLFIFSFLIYYFFIIIFEGVKT